MRFYVYAHELNGEVRYIGKGTGRRAYDKSKRSKRWDDLFKNGFEIRILNYFSSEKDALRAELDLINRLPNLINIRKENATKEVPVHLLEILEYSENSPSGLVWKKRVNRKHAARAVAGVRCYRRGNIPTHWSIMHEGVRYVAHRIVALLNGLKLSDEDVVNHIDCNPFNNVISNLEVCTKEENCRRKSNSLGIRLSSNNTSGENGVSEIMSSHKDKYFYYYALATLTIDGKTKSKKFSYNTHGKERAWELARQWRKKNVSY